MVIPDWIDQRTLVERLQIFYSHWRFYKKELWGCADIFAIATPPNKFYTGYPKSSTFNRLLLGYDLPGTVAVYGNKQIHFLCSEKKIAKLLRIVKRTLKRTPKGVVDVDMIIHWVKDSDAISKMDYVLQSMRLSDSEVHDAPIVGYMAKDSPEGSLFKKWVDRLNNCGLQLSDITKGLSDFLAEGHRIIDRHLVVGRKRDYASAFKKNSKEVIQYDRKHKVVLLPKENYHVGMLRRVSCLPSDKLCSIRITFNEPGTLSTLPSDVDSLKHLRASYYKEASYSSQNPKYCCKMLLQIQKHILRGKAGSSKYEIAERTMEIPRMQHILECPRDKVNLLKLLQVSIHPPLGGQSKEKMFGALEAHVNGFRYTTSPGVCVDIIYANINHAIFQSEKTGKMITLLHFHLHNHIMVGNKETKDVQFCVEAFDPAFDLIETLGDAKTSKKDFKEFVEAVDDLWSQPQFKALGLKFERTLDEFGFHGVVPNKACAFIVPTANCLVELMFTPFLVIPISEIDIVTLERIRPRKTDFDMAIVFKDFKRDVMRIDSIPAASFNIIKKWLHTVTDIEYFEISRNLHWRAIMKTFIDNPNLFADLGGWGFLLKHLI